MSSYCRGMSSPSVVFENAMYSRPKYVADARNNPGETALATMESWPGEVSLKKLPSESRTSKRCTRFVVMYVFSPLTAGVAPSAGNIESRPGRVRTPPGKNSTSRASGDIPGSTSDGSSSVIHEPNVVSGTGRKVSTDMCVLWDCETNDSGESAQRNRLRGTLAHCGKS